MQSRARLIILILIIGPGCLQSQKEVCESQLPQFESEVQASLVKLRIGFPESSATRGLASVPPVSIASGVSGVSGVSMVPTGSAVSAVPTVPSVSSQVIQKKILSEKNWESWAISQLKMTQRVLHSVAAYSQLRNAKLELSQISQKWVEFYAYSQSKNIKMMFERLEEIQDHQKITKQLMCKKLETQPSQEKNDQSTQIDASPFQRKTNQAPL